MNAANKIKRRKIQNLSVIETVRPEMLNEKYNFENIPCHSMFIKTVHSFADKIDTANGEFLKFRFILMLTKHSVWTDI